jgi:hypothetical protein
MALAVIMYTFGKEKKAQLAREISVDEKQAL